MANNSTLPTYIECGYNWTGPYLGVYSSFESSEIAGYISCLIACLLYGSLFVPFKFVKTGDGFFCQWVMCAGIWLTGLAAQLAREQPQFFSLNLLGGAIWCIGNCCTVPIINLIGLSIGMLVWNCTNVLLGWATSRFGLFVCPQVPADEVLNYVGVTLCVLSGAVYVFVKTETTVTLPKCLQSKKSYSVSEGSVGRDGDDTQFNTNPGSVVAVGVSSPDGSRTHLTGEDSDAEKRKDIFLGNLPESWRRIIGVSLSLASGCCYGVQFLPSIYIQDHIVFNGARASPNGMDYVFAQFCGIFFASTIIFGVYMVVNRKTALVTASIVLPGLLAGVMWGIATIAFFIANSALSAAITFPIIATVPGMIATLWGIFLFREIRGRRNFLILAVAFTLTISGAVLTGLSKTV